MASAQPPAAAALRRPRQRRCVGCGRRADAYTFVRFVLRAGRVVPDATRRLPGRGAHVCPRRGCVQRAVQRRALLRALRAPKGLSVDPETLLAEAAQACSEALRHVEAGGRRARLIGGDGVVAGSCPPRFAERLGALRALRSQLARCVEGEAAGPGPGG